MDLLEILPTSSTQSAAHNFHSLFFVHSHKHTHTPLQSFLYGNHVLKSGLGRITENTPLHHGVVIYSMNDLPLVGNESFEIFGLWLVARLALYAMLIVLVEFVGGDEKKNTHYQVIKLCSVYLLHGATLLSVTFFQFSSSFFLFLRASVWRPRQQQTARSVGENVWEFAPRLSMELTSFKN